MSETIETHVAKLRLVTPNVYNTLAEGRWTGWLFSDSAAVACPNCSAPRLHYCITPKGRKKWPPHRERTDALLATGYSAHKRAIRFYDKI